MTVYAIDPLVDPRWPAFLENRPDASVFHSRGWLEALKRTYGYLPVVYTTCAPGMPLTDGIALCQVNSRLTGRRLVSVPFSDHCEPLTDEPDDLHELLRGLVAVAKQEKLKYVELRPLTGMLHDCAEKAGFVRSQEFFFHTVDITPEPEVLFQQFHRTCVRVKIGRAEREGLLYEEGRSEKLLSKFYGLLLLTRRKYHVPPPPIAWFRNLAECVGENLTIRVASKDGNPVSAIITILYNNTCFYKYTGVSQDAAKMGGTHALAWRAICDSRALGATKLDFGRTDLDNETLMEYKDRWASTRSGITYYRYPESSVASASDSHDSGLAGRIFACLPDKLLILAGNYLYKHVG